MRPTFVLATAVLSAVVAVVAADEFEVPADEPPSASLPPAQAAGDNFHIQDPVHSDGLMHHYVIESRFGVFTAYGRDALEVRLHEVAAMNGIANTADTDVVFKSVTRGMQEDAKSMLRVATHPVGTVLGIPKGIKHLLGGYRAQAEEAGAEAKKAVKGGEASADGSNPSGNVAKRTATQAEHLAVHYADRYLGLSAAERRWYAKFSVDPYTDNEVLRHAIKRLAKIDAAATFGMRFAPVGIPFAGEVNRALNAIYKEDPAVLRKRRHEALAAAGLTLEEIGHFENTMLLDPTRQTMLVDAVKALDGVEGRAELLRHAMTVTSADEIEVFLRSTSLLVRAHARQPVARILAGLRVPSAQRADGSVAIFGAFDAVQWTAEVAAYERAIHSALPADAPRREVWLSGRVSARARTELERLGWAVHEQADAALAPSPS